MWIIPNTHTLYSAFAADMVVLNSASDLQALNIEQSLMWRSKPSSVKTWWTRCKRKSYLQRLFGQTLKPYQWSLFETELTSLLAATHVSHFPPQESAQEKMTPDTSGLTSQTSSDQYDLLDASLKTSKDTSASDCEKSSSTWKASVIKRRGEYLARLSAARDTRESEFTSWPTPAARDYKDTMNTRATMRPDKPTRSRMDTLPRKVQVVEGAQPGHLNPSWVEWLMGIPQGWTALIGE